MTASLAAVGYHQPSSVALVETARPGHQPYDVVLSQNAWNYLPGGEFRALSRDYTPRRRGLYRARRVVANLNARRAGTNVVLSSAMHDLLTSRGLRSVVTPVTLPLDLCSPTPPPMDDPGGIDGPFVLAPGTLTPYKNADYALDLLAQLPAGDRPLLVLAGTDDGSGQQQRVRQLAARAGVRHVARPVTREEMTWLLVRSVATVVASRLESLSFSIAEALALSPRVLASPLTVHREVAGRLGRQPHWLDPRADLATARLLLGPAPPAPTTDRSRFRREWDDLASVLTACSKGR